MATRNAPSDRRCSCCSESRFRFRLWLRRLRRLTSFRSRTYQSAQSVSISDATSGAAIYFTTDGSTPTRNSAHYTAPILVAVNTTIKAIALATGLTRSAVATARYTIVQPAATPVLTPGSGSYSTAQQVAISDATPGATIYYTEDGSTPTRSSARYTAPITVSHSETIKAAAFATGYSRSNTAAATYRISGGGVAKPTFSPAAGTYDSELTVSLHDATPGATIYYTTDGTAPTENSQVYVDPIPATTTQTIKAIAQVPGGSSAVASATYQVPESVLYSFRFDGSDAVNPAAGLIQGSDGGSTGRVTSAGQMASARSSPSHPQVLRTCCIPSAVMMLMAPIPMPACSKVLAPSTERPSMAEATTSEQCSRSPRRIN